MKKPKKTISERLNAMQIAISNTFGDPVIKELVASFGYDDNRLNEGKELYTTALMSMNIQTASGGTQKDSTAKVLKAEKIARNAYQDLAKVARAIFKNDKAKLKMLGLEGKMPSRIGEFLGTAYTLFNNAEQVEEVKKELSKYGYTDKKIAAEKQKIADYDLANQQQEAAKGSAQNSTREQDAALEKMDEWYAQYVKIAKVALKDHKELLEKLGVLARTVKTKAQRGAGKKAAETRKAKK
jgi:hypothetical protein